MNRINYLKELREEEPGDSFVLFALAQEYEKEGNRQKALQYYLELYESNPQYIGLYYHLGKLYEQLEEFDKALNCYEEGMERAGEAGDDHSRSELNTAHSALQIALED